MSMETGVEGGSMLVPEVVCLSSASIRVVAGFIMSMMGGAGVFTPGMFCMSEMAGCFVWAKAAAAKAKTAANSAVESGERMDFLCLDGCEIVYSARRRCVTQS
jgi:hypothetical protein